MTYQKIKKGTHLKVLRNIGKDYIIVENIKKYAKLFKKKGFRFKGAGSRAKT